MNNCVILRVYAMRIFAKFLIRGQKRPCFFIEKRLKKVFYPTKNFFSPTNVYKMYSLISHINGSEKKKTTYFSYVVFFFSEPLKFYIAIELLYVALPIQVLLKFSCNPHSGSLRIQVHSGFKKPERRLHLLLPA